MALLVETGAGILGADSYVATADCVQYATARGLDFASDDLGDAALRRATSYIDNTYRVQFPGYRTFRRAQALEWPRTNAYYTYAEPRGDTPYFVDPRMLYPFDLIGANTIPPEIIAATCEAAVREYAEPGALLPDLERGGLINSLKASSVEIRYAGGAPGQTAFQAIEAALSGLIGARNTYTARAQRV